METRSRVTPGMSWTMETRRPTRALEREDLPTLGRPTIATTGRRFMGGILGFCGWSAIAGDFIGPRRIPVSRPKLINSQCCVGRCEGGIFLRSRLLVVPHRPGSLSVYTLSPQPAEVFMPTVRDVLARKGESLITIQSGATVLEATRKMNQHKVGAVVVMDGERVAGIFSERDVLTRVVTEELSPSSVVVDDVMTREVICCEP